MSIAVLTPKLWRQAEAELSATDKTMAKIIAQCPPKKHHKKEPPFHVLTVSIINQQLSQKAADAIETRIAAIVGTPFAAAALLSAAANKLRTAGLSANKIKYLHELAQRTENGTIPLAQFPKMADEDIIQSLIAAPGIGRWTGEMFLMFALRRPDIVALGDGALRRAARNLYGHRYVGDDVAVLDKCAKKWRPWRTVGCHYLWRSLDK